jgi:hypothetical protein
MPRFPEILACPACPSSARQAGQTECITRKAVLAESRLFALEFGFSRASREVSAVGIVKKTPLVPSSVMVHSAGQTAGQTGRYGACGASG